MVRWQIIQGQWREYQRIGRKEENNGKEYQIWLCCCVVCLLVPAGWPDWDFPHSNNVSSCKVSLSTQSVEQISQYGEFGGVTLWRRKLALEQLSCMGTPQSLAEIDRLERWFSLNDCFDSSELCAKIAADKIRREKKDIKERINALAQMLESDKHEFLDEAATELYNIGTEEARKALLSLEDKGDFRAKRHRLRMEVRNLSIDEATDYLLGLIYECCSLHGSEAIKKMTVERSCVLEVMSRDMRAFLLHISKCQEQFNGKRNDKSEADNQYGKLLQIYAAHAKQSIQNEEACRASQKQKKDQEKAQKPTPSLAHQKASPAKPIYTDEEIVRMQAEMRERLKEEDWKAKEKKELLEILTKSEDKIRLRKAAKELGDRYIAGTEDIGDADREQISEIVRNCLQLARSPEGNDRESARMQVEGLWSAAIPELLKHVDSEELSVLEFSHKSLSLMRNENIMRALLDMAQGTSDTRRRMMVIIELGHMTEKRESVVAGRQQKDTDEMKAFISNQVRPFLKHLSEDDKDDEMRKIASRALKTLDQAPDRRLIKKQ